VLAIAGGALVFGYAAWSTPRIALWNLAMLGLMVAAGGYALVARTRTHYAVTSRHLLITDGRGAMTLELDMIASIVLDPQAGGRGTLVFEPARFGLVAGGPLPDREEESALPRFDRIADAAHVKETIERARSKASQ
jgi:hypothetical protein